MIRTMRHLATVLVLVSGLCLFSGLPVYAQNKTACELVSEADAEAIPWSAASATEALRTLSLAPRPGFHQRHA